MAAGKAVPSKNDNVDSILSFPGIGELEDQVLVAQQLGQKGTSATDLYTHIDQTKQREALNKISKKDKESK